MSLECPTLECQSLPGVQLSVAGVPSPVPSPRVSLECPAPTPSLPGVPNPRVCQSVPVSTREGGDVRSQIICDAFLGFPWELIGLRRSETHDNSPLHTLVPYPPEYRSSFWYCRIAIGLSHASMGAWSLGYLCCNLWKCTGCTSLNWDTPLQCCLKARRAPCRKATEQLHLLRLEVPLAPQGDGQSLSCLSL